MYNDNKFFIFIYIVFAIYIYKWFENVIKMLFFVKKMFFNVLTDFKSKYKLIIHFYISFVLKIIF